MFGIGKPGAKSLIQKLRGRGLTLDQIAAVLPPDGQGRPVSRVTLSKVLGGEYSGAQLVERLRVLVDGKPSQAAPPERLTLPSQRRRGESRRTIRPHKPGRVGSTPTPATTSAPAIPLPDDVAPTEIGAPVYFDKDVIGYVGPNGAIVKERPQPPAMPPARPTRQPQSPVPARHALREQYNVLRQAGLSDSEAQRRLREQRETQQAERRETERASAWEHQVAKLAPQFVAAARRHLAGAGVYLEEQVAELARHMAARSLVLGQPPRQGDVVRALPPPRLPALPPPQVAEPIWQGIRRQGRAAVGRVALGGERRVLPEVARQAIRERVAELARREGGGKL